MSFFSELLNKIRGINNEKRGMQTFVFGSIISGTYANYLHDPHPTILCIGSFVNKNGEMMVHGIQLHYLDYSELVWITTIIKNIKTYKVVTNPRLFYNYIKLNNPQIIKKAYRTYKTGLSNFKTINPGFSNIIEKYCYSIDDGRDSYLNQLKQTERKVVNTNLNDTTLRNNITKVINTVKIW